MTRSELRRIFRLSCLLVLALGGLLVDYAIPRESGLVRSPEWLWVKDARLGYRNRPNATYENFVAGSVNHTGRWGERRTVPANEGRPCVLVAGDSTTFCCEVDDGETTVSWLARLRPNRRFINLGVRGYNTIQSMRLVDEWLEREPAASVLYVWCSNDETENLRPDVFGRPPCPTLFGEARVDWSGAWPWPYPPEFPTLIPTVTPLLVKGWRDRLGRRLTTTAFVTRRDYEVIPELLDIDPRPAFGEDDEPCRARLRDGKLDSHYGKLGTRAWARYVAPRLP